ncbi:MAG: S41 family peptidase [Anaerolineales bacterium]|nr:S41 family peptidase [Anaerolineales bacterium]
MKKKSIIFSVMAVLVVSVLCLVAVFAVAWGAYTILDKQGVTTGEIQNIPLVDSPPATPESPAFEAIEPETTDPADLDLEALFSPFWESWDILHDEYVEQPLDDEALMQGAIEGLTFVLDEADVDYSTVDIPASARSVDEIAKTANTPRDLIDMFEPFWELWQATEHTDLNGFSYEDLEIGALRGMVNSLGDPYTSYLDPGEYSEMLNYLNGADYEGIGAWVDTSGEYLTITSPMDSSPAEAAGLKPKDEVIAIDGKDMTDVDPEIARQHVLGPAGSTVILTIKRPGVDEPFDVEIVRASITTPIVISEMRDDGIAYLRLTTFGSTSAAEMHSALEELLAQNPKGLVFDLRYNGGGYVDAAIAVMSEFVDDGVVLYQQYGDGSRDEYYAQPGGIATDIPMVVLVNEATVSAAEITAGTLQDYERATLVGETTFGKGLVQLPIELPDNNGVLKVTISYWLTPNERLIQEIGLEPDVVVPFTEEDAAADVDPQIEKAVEILLGQ